MFTPTSAYASFSVDDIAAAKKFYGETLGLAVTESDMGTLRLALPGGTVAFIYPKDNHEPASFTVLNFVAEDVAAAVDQLNAAGVRTKIYENTGDEDDLHTDDKGIADGHDMQIAWFRDPAGNVLSVVSG